MYYEQLNDLSDEGGLTPSESHTPRDTRARTFSSGKIYRVLKFFGFFSLAGEHQKLWIIGPVDVNRPWLRFLKTLNK